MSIDVTNPSNHLINHPTLSSSEQFLQFFELLTNLLDDFSDKNIPVYLLGDFNLDVLKYGIVKQVSEYIDLLFSFGFLQLIIKPTRCTPHSASILDHVVTNSRSNFHDSCIFISKISDHFPIFHFLESQPQNSKTPFVSFRDFSQNNIVRFSESIRNINWNRVSNIDNAQEAYNEFSNIFFNFYDLYFPVQTKKSIKTLMPMNRG